MFGHDEQTGQNDNNAPTADANLGDQNSGGQQDTPQGAPALGGDDSSQNYIMTDPPAPAGGPAPDNGDGSDAGGDATGSSNDASPAPAGPTDSGAASVGPNDLLDIKQQALQQLTPLVGHLDQTPEEKFRTTMMMIQASDNDALIKEAYAAAQQITDEKARAQALLDIVNEINYFTQNQESDQQQPAA